MRVAKILVGGGVTTALAFAVARSDDGTLGAAAVMLVMFFAVTTIGLAAAALVDSWATRPWRQHAAATAVDQCTGCGGARHSTAGLWICAHCDQTAAV